jgi:hypothetical protein
MSAYKTAVIRMGESEYQRLREAEEQLRVLELKQWDQPRSDALDASIFDRILHQNQERSQEFEAALVGLDREVRSIEQDSSDWIQSQIEQVESQLNQSHQSLRTQNEQQFSHLADQFNQVLAQHNRDFSNQLAQQETRLGGIETRLDLYRAEAKKWIEASLTLADFIPAHYLLDASTANRIEVENQQLNIAVEEYEQGMLESACGTGLRSYATLSHIRTQLEAAETLRTLNYERLIALADQVRGRVERQMQVHAMDVDGNELDERINVNFWTDGAYAELVENLNMTLKSISSQPGMYDPEIEAARRDLLGIERQAEELVTQARMNILSSQLRFNIAQIVVQALETQGFNLEEAQFNRSDYRDSFTAKTRNLSGNEVVVTIDPTPDIEEGGKLHIHSTDGEQITEHELLQRNQEIFQAIQAAGLDVSNIQASSSGMNDVRKRQPQKLAQSSRVIRANSTK